MHLVHTEEVTRTYYDTTQFSCFQYDSSSPGLVPTSTAMTFCWLSLVTMMGALLVLVHSASNLNVALDCSDAASVAHSRARSPSGLVRTKVGAHVLGNRRKSPVG